MDRRSSGRRCCRRDRCVAARAAGSAGPDHERRARTGRRTARSAHRGQVVGNATLRQTRGGASAVRNGNWSKNRHRACLRQEDPQDARPRHQAGARPRPEYWTMTIRFETLRRKWMKDPKFRAEYERIGPEMDLAMTLAEARRKAGLTQAELAARMKTSQAAVARIESGHGAPKWSTVERYARALGARPVVRLLEAAE